ncbi:MAG: TonB-dependent receptor [Aquabacterium sp.]
MLSILIWSASAQAASEEEEELSMAFGDKATISIATGSAQPLRRAPAVATVITAEDIRALGATDLDEVLETVPGIHVSRNVQGYNPLFVIRGIYSEFNPQTLVLQNGVPMTMMFIGNRGNIWGGLPLDNVARIEVIRGPGSALYGADAYSGVVNIITKSAAEIDGSEGGVRVGAFNTWDVWGQHGSKIGDLEVAAYVRIGATDGADGIIDSDAQTLFDAQFNTQSSLAPGPVGTGHDAADASFEIGRDKFRLRAGYRLRNNVGLGGGASSALDPTGRARTERINADVSWSDIAVAPDLKLGVNLSYLRYVTTYPVPLQLFPPGAFENAFPNGMFGAPNTWEDQLRGSALLTYSGLAGHQLRLGLGLDDLDMYRTQEFKNFTLSPGPTPTPGAEVQEFPVSESFSTPHRRKVGYVYVQDEWNFAQDWALTAGVRHDHYSDFGGTTNPRVALVWDASLDLTAKLLYGRAFRAPSFSEKYSINNPILQGNPNLKPEVIHTLETAFSWQARPDTQLQFSVFQYQMKDIIRTAGFPATRSNSGEQHGGGFELEATHDVRADLRLSGNYAYQRSTDETTGQDAGYAPHHHLYGRVDWRLGNGLTLAGQVNRVAGRARPPGDTRAPIDDYTTMDFTVRTKRFQGGWDLAFTVRNLFDDDVREPSLYSPGNPRPVLIQNDLPMAGRTWLVQLSYRM